MCGPPGLVPGNSHAHHHRFGGARLILVFLWPAFDVFVGALHPVFFQRGVVHTQNLCVGRRPRRIDDIRRVVSVLLFWESESLARCKVLLINILNGTVFFFLLSRVSPLCLDCFVAGRARVTAAFPGVSRFARRFREVPNDVIGTGRGRFRARAGPGGAARGHLAVEGDRS